MTSARRSALSTTLNNSSRIWIIRPRYLRTSKKKFRLRRTKDYTENGRQFDAVYIFKKRDATVLSG